MYNLANTWIKRLLLLLLFLATSLVVAACSQADPTGSGGNEPPPSRVERLVERGEICEQYELGDEDDMEGYLVTYLFLGGSTRQHLFTLSWEEESAQDFYNHNEVDNIWVCKDTDWQEATAIQLAGRVTDEAGENGCSVTWPKFSIDIRRIEVTACVGEPEYSHTWLNN